MVVFRLIYRSGRINLTGNDFLGFSGSLLEENEFNSNYTRVSLRVYFLSFFNKRRERPVVEFVFQEKFKIKEK
jgi:hypothetical protein